LDPAHFNRGCCGIFRQPALFIVIDRLFTVHLLLSEANVGARNTVHYLVAFAFAHTLPSQRLIVQ
jgi:hypothetical protein